MASRRPRPVTWPSRIVVRLLAFNLLLVFLPVAGILYLDVYQTRLLESENGRWSSKGACWQRRCPNTRDRPGHRREL